MSEQKRMRQYETTFILAPTLTEEEAKATFNKFLNIAKEGGATIIHTEEMGLRTLAYPIKRNTSGYYFYFEFQAPSSFISKLEREYQIDTNVIRFLTVSLDKHAIAFNIKRREGAFNQPKNTTTE
ncbi:MAG: 30S ribosomal protein S6 [Bacteroidia bacterium]|nr:30S ribosomal protein S6 [Bacteroidia bacterium]MDW8302045.1 30S ribosomal protein S6 [Bacteroidia bacterium]